MATSGGEGSHHSLPCLQALELQFDPPLDEEAERVSSLSTLNKGLPALIIVQFAFQSLGVVYGELSTSPLYVYPNTFPHGIGGEEDLLGVLSLIIYTLTFIPLIKYTLIVMRSNDSGEGGTFALYSLICRHAKIATIPNQHPTDCDLTTYRRKKLAKKSLAGKVKHWLESKAYAQKILVILVLLGTCMLIGDGILTPAISVLSSVGGITDKSQDLVVGISVVILIGIFSLQRFGTDKVGWLFAPIVLVWLLSIGSIGVYNIFKHDSSVFRAFSPYYIIRYFSQRKKDGWLSLGGIVLSITGSEAMYADIGHFSSVSVQAAFATIVFPCLLASYMGQAAYLRKFPHEVETAFYSSIPGPIHWPIFLLATLAAIIASQSIITATFSIVKQSLVLGFFPRVKVVHTSKKFQGQIYIPEINWFLMLLCVSVTAGFRETSQIGNAYGVAVLTVMLVTTLLMALVMVMIIRTNILLVAGFVLFFLFIELIYFSSVLSKVGDGGWLPLAVAGVFLIIMYSWHYGTLKKYQFEMQNKVSLAWIIGLSPSLGLVRIPGICLVYTELAHGVPSIFSHYVTHIPAVHTILVFVCIKYLPVNTVPQDERFLMRRIGPREYRMYRCVVRYGYKDLHKKDDRFEQNLIEHLGQLIVANAFSVENCSSSYVDDDSNTSPQIFFVEDSQHTPNSSMECSINPCASIHEAVNLSIDSDDASGSVVRPERQYQGFDSDPGLNEMQELGMAKEAGVVHIIGDIVVRATRDSGVLKKLAIDYIYALLRRICRENSATLNIPHEGLFTLGQVYYI